MKRTRDEHTGGYGLCTKCNTWVKNRTASFYKLHHNWKCIRNVDTVEAANPPYALGNNETEVYVYIGSYIYIYSSDRHLVSLII